MLKRRSEAGPARHDSTKTVAIPNPRMRKLSSAVPFVEACRRPGASYCDNRRKQIWGEDPHPVGRDVHQKPRNGAEDRSPDQGWAEQLRLDECLESPRRRLPAHGIGGGDLDRERETAVQRPPGPPARGRLSPTSEDSPRPCHHLKMSDGDRTTEFFESLYAGAGDDYSQIPWAQLSPRPVLVDWLDAEPPAVGARALVIACGLGDDAEELARRGCVVDAFDVSPAAIDAARHRFPDSRVTYLVADLFALPSSWRGRFELIVEVQTIQSLPPGEHRAAVAAISTCLAPGARMFLRTAVRDEDEPALSRPWPLKLSELRWFEDEGLELTARLGPGEDEVAHLEYRRAPRDAQRAR
jgi:SAM-dependent methyltransferase